MLPGWVVPILCIHIVSLEKFKFLKQTWFESYFLLVLIISATFAYCWVATAAAAAAAEEADNDEEEDTDDANRRVGIGGGGALLLLQVLEVSSLVEVLLLLSIRLLRQTILLSGDCIVVAISLSAVNPQSS